MGGDFPVVCSTSWDCMPEDGFDERFFCAGVGSDADYAATSLTRNKCGHNKIVLPDIPMALFEDSLVVGTHCLIALLGSNVPGEELHTLSFSPKSLLWG